MKKSIDVSDINGLASDFSRFYILMIIYERPRHGYEIISEFGDRVGKKISAGLVYPFLQKLEKKGLIEFTAEFIGRKERKIYDLTPEGRDFADRLFSRFADIVSTALEPSLDTCSHCGCKIYEGGHLEEINGEDRMFCCVHCASHYKQEISQMVV